MDLNDATRNRLATLLQLNLKALYDAKREAEIEWKQVENDRKDVEQRQESIEEERRLIVEQIGECKDLLRLLGSG